MPKTKVEVYDKDQLIYPFIESDHVTFSNGMKITEMLDQSISMPKVTHEDSSFKVGVGDQDVSSAIVDSSVAEMTIKGKTYQNILPEPSTHVLTNNKEMFKVNERLDPNVEIVDGVSKSAILKGQTLVNISKFESNIERTSTGVSQTIYSNDVTMLKTSTTYTFIYWIESTSGTTVSNITTLDGSDTQMFDRKILQSSGNLESNFILKFSQTSRDFTGHYGLKFSALNGSVKLVKSVILEGDYTNVDIPYFEGMASVKMPVLKTIGKNLYADKGGKINSDIVLNTGLEVVGNRFIPNSYTQVSPGKTHTLYRKNATSNIGIRFYDINKKYIPSTNSIYSSTNILVFKTPSDCYYIRFIDEGNKLDNAYAVYSGDHSSSFEYEPYKTNILSTPEEVVLRSLPNGVCDTLNLNTGEYIQRIGETVLDGSWGAPSQELNGYFISYYSLSDIKKENGGNVYCDKFASHGQIWVGGREGISTFSNGTIWLSISSSKLATSDIDGMKKWLSQNPTTVQYELATPITKTVDLSSSGNWEKVVLDGGESWVLHNNSGDYVEFRCANMINNIHDSRLGFSNKFPVSAGGQYERIAIANGTTYITVKNNKAQSVEQLQSWLSQNPITVWYQITATLDSTQVKQPIFFKDGHIQLSSGADNSLIPTLDYQAKTSNSYVMDLMKTNTRYTMKAKSASGTFTIDGISYGVGTNVTFTTPSSMTNKFLVMNNKTNKEAMILEGDVVSKTIPYFKGIKSAFEGEDKIEVLSTGKNLFDKNKVFYGKSTNGNGELIDSPQYVTSDLISVKPNTNYTVKHLVVVSMYDKNGSYIGGLNANHEQRTFTTPSNCSYIRIRNWGLLDTVELQKEVVEKTVLQEGDSIETYEPYKSNGTKIPLLHPLRSLPNGVYDEIILNRENNNVKMIRRVGRVVLNGEEDWAHEDEWHRWYSSCMNMARANDYATMILNNSENLPVTKNNTFLRDDTYGISGYELTSNYPNQNWIYIRPKNVSNTQALQSLLSQNPTTVLYELATPIITEIDLEGFPYIYKDGHIFLNSDIAPTTQITYSINQAQQIESANENLQRHEKEISHLQKLIAQYIQVEYESTLLSLKV